MAPLIPQGISSNSFDLKRRAPCKRRRGALRIGENCGRNCIAKRDEGVAERLDAFDEFAQVSQIKVRVKKAARPSIANDKILARGANKVLREARRVVVPLLGVNIAEVLRHDLLAVGIALDR